VPVIHFSTGTGAYITDVAEAGGDVIGVDWRMPLDWYREQLGHERPIQGNLDPCALLAPWRELRYQIDDVLDRAGGRPGHIFNLGHGIFPDTPVDNVRRLVDYVHERTSGGKQEA
jgi:uroporphyrinogen decarboxylase